MPRPDRLVAVNVSAADLVKNYEPDVAVLGDAKLVLAELTTRLGPRAADDAELRELRTRTWERLRRDAAGRPALTLLDAVDTAVARTDATVWWKYRSPPPAAASPADERMISVPITIRQKRPIGVFDGGGGCR